MWETVDLREIRVFLALAEELHFGRAAERLGITQSRVSQSLRELEDKLGEMLLYRTSRRVDLTPAGERFLAEVEPAHAALTDVLKRASDDGGDLEGRVLLGLLTAVHGGPRLIEIIEAFETMHPRCRVEVRGVTLMNMFDTLRQGDVDLMVTGLPLEQPDLVVGPTLTREPRVLGVACDHPLAERSVVSAEDIADYEVADITTMVPPEVADAYIPGHAPSGRPMKRRRVEHADVSELVTMIARGTLVHPTVPSVGEHVAHPDIRYVPISDLPEWETALVWRRRRPSRRLRAFIAVAEDVLSR